MKETTILILGWMLAASPVAAAEGPVDYELKIKPIFKARCFSCHGALKQESGLRLDTGALIRKGGDSGAAVVPGKTDESSLIERITSKDEADRMPPEGKPLSADQIKLIRAWIRAGALSPKNEQAEEDPRKHWAFQRPVRAKTSDVKNAAWVRNSIDAFIAADHEKRRLQPAPPAEKHVLLRRVYLDLIGLPPTREELHAFLANESADAYEDVVDRLLSSPQYGERWGRHWMDVWRYSDWYGRRNVPDVLNSYAQIWRWRDWIVRSLNEDKGYGRMVMEMLAADEIAPADDENIVATGFIVRNFYRWNYNTWMKDSVEHTGKAFLALTLNCCHCHKHKYDPIENEEYFRFRAFFEPIEMRHDRVRGEPDPGMYPKYSYGASYKPITSGMVRIFDEKLDAKTFIYSGGEARNVIPGKPPVVPAAPAVLGGDRLEIKPIDLPPEAWYPASKPFIQQEEIAKRQTDVTKVAVTLKQAREIVTQTERQLADAKKQNSKSPDKENSAAVTKAELALAAAKLTLKVDKANFVRTNAELTAIKSRIHADNVRYKGVAGDPVEAGKAAAKAERQAKLETARVELARAERAHAPASQTGKAKAAKTAQRVKTAAAALDKAIKELAKDSEKYTPLGPTYPKQSTGRRTALARWLADKKNPLTARVAINHIWLRHFGRAFVETTENFGRSGSRPTHPKLFDWLAVELMDNGWRMKHIHRLIVTSSTYRQSSVIPGTAIRKSDSTPAAYDPQSIDGDNVYLWRFSPSRMEAEVLRDSMLHVAGSLDKTLGGKEINQNLGLTSPRRSLYFEHHGEGRMQFLDLFDAADPCDCYRRSTSVRPQQALAMANSKLALHQGRLLAGRLENKLGKGQPDSVFIAASFEQVLTRKPTEAELKASVAFLKKQQELFQSVKKQAAPAGSKNDPVPPSTDPVLRARQSLIQALFSHHDFVTIR